MKRGFPLLTFLLLGVSAASHAFTLDIASHEVTEFGQGPRSIFVPGYGEVAFESFLDGVLVVDSAYASTDRIELPPPSIADAAEPCTDITAAGNNPGFVEIANRSNPDLSPPLHPVDGSIDNPPDGWNAVPEAASATLGLVGTLFLLLRRRMETISKVPGKP